jgi:quercetin dioxygenase-like cupin family protein
MFNKKSKDGYLTPLDGIQRKTLVHGESTLMTEFKLRKGSSIPLHNHPQEQIGYLISGQIAFLVGSEKIVCNPGDSWCFAGGEEHGAEVLQDAEIVEVFSPVREDYLPADSGE